MFLHAIAHQLPPAAYTQPECWRMLEERPYLLDKLRPRSVDLLKRLLLNPESPIIRRHFCAEDFGRVFAMEGGYLNALFEEYAPRLAGGALSHALEKAGLRAEDLDALFICTCTGYLCPGVTSHVAEQLGLRRNAYLQDLVGLGCGAAIPMLRSAAGFHRLHPQSRVACVAVEVCSTAFYLDDDPGVLVSLCLFGDGASASIWGPESSTASGYRATGFNTLHQPEHREKLRFRNHRGCLRNQLHRSVPELAAGAVFSLWQADGAGSAEIVSHGGGRDVLEAIEARLGCARLDSAHAVLADCGNLSSPSVLLALERNLKSDTKENSFWLTGFGAGFSAHSMFLEKA